MALPSIRMTSSGNWDSLRQSFAEQFEARGNSFVYRRSQKGEAIVVSSAERDRFVEQYDRHLRGAIWILSVGLVVVLGGIILLSVIRGWDLPQAAIYAGIGAVAIPYMAYFRWAWGAPARELAGRTPIAGARSAEEVRRLQFQRITYGQLAIAALFGIAVPFIGGRGQDLFSGWNRLWFVFGGAIVVFAAAQAFRKWRFEQEYPDAYASAQSNPPARTSSFDEGAPETEETSQIVGLVKRYAPLVVLGLGFAFIGLTQAGKRLAQTPSFWPIMMMAFAAWSLFTVAQGFAKGRITPFARGFYNSYDREAQPKRFWASMAWNTLFGCFFVWIAATGAWDASARATEDRCYNEHDQVSPKESLLACTKLIDGKSSSTYLTKADELAYRGFAEEQLNDHRAAFADFSEAIRLHPTEFAYFERGLIFLEYYRLDQAIADFSRAHQLDAKELWPLANRGLAYALMRKPSQAEADFVSVEATDKTNPVMLRGRAVLAINAMNMAEAVNYLTASLKSDPGNLWAIRTRAWAYRQLGDDQHADADIRAYEKLSGRSAFSNR